MDSGATAQTHWARLWEEVEVFQDLGVVIRIPFTNPQTRRTPAESTISAMFFLIYTSWTFLLLIASLDCLTSSKVAPGFLLLEACQSPLGWVMGPSAVFPQTYWLPQLCSQWWSLSPCRGIIGSHTPARLGV